MKILNLELKETITQFLHQKSRKEFQRHKNARQKDVVWLHRKVQTRIHIDLIFRYL